MVRSVRSGFVLFALVLGASCDSDEPLLVGTQNATVEFIPNNATVEHFRVWDVTEDSDEQSGPDDVNGDGVAGDVSLWCEYDSPDQDADGSLGSVPSVPWTYSVKVRVVRDGDNQPTDLTSSDAATAEFNRGSYDESVFPHAIINPGLVLVTYERGVCSGNDQILCNPASTSTVCADNDAGTCEPQFGCSEDPATVCDPANLGDTCPNRGAGFCIDGFCSGDPGIVCEAGCVDLQLGFCGAVTETRRFSFASEADVGHLRPPNVKYLQPRQLLQVFHAGIRDLGPVELQMN